VGTERPLRVRGPRSSSARVTDRERREEGAHPPELARSSSGSRFSSARPSSREERIRAGEGPPRPRAHPPPPPPQSRSRPSTAGNPSSVSNARRPSAAPTPVLHELVEARSSVASASSSGHPLASRLPGRSRQTSRAPDERRQAGLDRPRRRIPPHHEEQRSRGEREWGRRDRGRATSEEKKEKN
jgi:hypothetical protein